MSENSDNTPDKIVAVIQKHIPGDYVPQLKPSKKGNYISVSINFVATSKPQLDQIYQEVNDIEDVKFCL